jgi:hypothetical protein
MPFQNWLPRTAYARYENFPRSQTEKSSGQCLSLICDESLTCQNLNLNPGHFDSFTFILVWYGESHLLVSWYADSKCGMACNNEYRGRSRRPDAEDREWLHRSGTRWLDDREVRWRRLWSAPCTRSAGFLVEHQNQGRRFSDLGLKTGCSGLVIWVSKSP